jgi:hypothetical protein
MFYFKDLFYYIWIFFEKVLTGKIQTENNAHDCLICLLIIGRDGIFISYFVDRCAGRFLLKGEQT